MGFERLGTYYVVNDQDGRPAIYDGLPPDERDVRGSVEACSPLQAHLAAFGVLPQLDPGIAALVLLLNEIPGIQTWSSCEGHVGDGDPNASVAVSFENLAAIENFSDLISFVVSDEAAESAEPPLDLCLVVDLGTHFGDGKPISCSLELGKYPMDRARPGKPPGPRALQSFTRELRRRAAARFPAAVSGLS